MQKLDTLSQQAEKAFKWEDQRRDVLDKKAEKIVAAIALIVAGSANLIVLNTLFTPLGTTLHAILTNIKILVAPAAIVVALKAVYHLAAK